MITWVAQTEAEAQSTLDSVGGVFVLGTPIQGQKFYKLTGVVTRPNVNATIYATIYRADKTGDVGAKVAGLRTDGKGQIELADSSGQIQIQLRSTAIFYDKGGGVFSVFVVSDDATKDDDTKFLTYQYVLSDVVKSLGDWQGAHQEIHLQFTEQTEAPPPPPPPPPPSSLLDFGDVVNLLRSRTILSSQITRLQAQVGMIDVDLANAFERLSKAK